MSPASALAPAPAATRAAPAGTALPPNEVCEQLARRLRGHTQGEVLFDTASRGRYATDASIYQVLPVGVFVPAISTKMAEWSSFWKNRNSSGFSVRVYGTPWKVPLAR
jgi:hypothetical protein